MTWMHEISQSALAAAVVMLGVVILLELRSVAHMRRHVEGSLARLFEQLDLLRFENQQLLEAQELARDYAVKRQTFASPRQAPVGPTTGTTAMALAVTSAVSPTLGAAPLPAGEARLLASLAAARARRAQGASEAQQA